MVEGTVRVESAASTEELRSARRDEGSGTDPGAAPHTAPDTRMTVQQVVISAGEQLVIEPGTADHVRRGDPERVTSWRRGQVVFDGVRLGDAITELNRYSDTRVELADPELGNIRISGSFATGQPQVFIEAVTTYFPIEVSRTSAEAVQLKARRP